MAHKDGPRRIIHEKSGLRTLSHISASLASAVCFSVLHSQGEGSSSFPGGPLTSTVNAGDVRAQVRKSGNEVA